MSAGSEPEIVLTAPPELNAGQFLRSPYRETLGAITQLVAGARRHIILGSPFLEFKEVLCVGPIGGALAAAMNRGVRVDLVSTKANLVGIPVGAVGSGDIPSRLRLFQPVGNRSDERSLGSHAKFCLVDHEHAYLGSANLTEKGMTEHLELGVIVHGAAARHLWAIFEQLFRTGYFSEFPTSS